MSQFNNKATDEDAKKQLYQLGREARRAQGELDATNSDVIFVTNRSYVFAVTMVTTIVTISNSRRRKS